MRIGTRGSRLALIQAESLRQLLIANFEVDPDALEIVTVRTTGDAILDRPLYEVGGKGLFVREIDDALLGGAIDVAVHSMKDRPGVGVEGIRTCCYLEREDVRDALVSMSGCAFQSLPQGSRIGSSSPRRRSQIRNMRPDLEVVAFRGNVETRLRKLARGDAEATVLAVAGLKRLGLDQHVTAPFDPDDMLPAIGQGAIGIDARVADEDLVNALAAITHEATAAQMAAERACLERLGGSCRSAIAGLAELHGTDIHLRCEILHPNGDSRICDDLRGPTEFAGEIGAELAERLLGDTRARQWLNGQDQA